MRRALLCLAAAMAAPGHPAWADPPPSRGVLVIAHGGDARWNEHVKRIVARVRETIPAEPAFLMGVPDQLDRKHARYLPVPGRRLYAGLVVRHER